MGLAHPLQMCPRTGVCRCLPKEPLEVRGHVPGSDLGSNHPCLPPATGPSTTSLAPPTARPMRLGLGPPTCLHRQTGSSDGRAHSCPIPARGKRWGEGKRWGARGTGTGLQVPGLPSRAVQGSCGVGQLDSQCRHLHFLESCSPGAGVGGSRAVPRPVLCPAIPVPAVGHPAARTLSGTAAGFFHRSSVP